MSSGYTYDAAGDITDDGQNAYLYDGAGRICAVKNLNSGVMTQYIYDGEGNRVAKGTLSSWPAACQAPTTGNGFTLSVQYVTGLGGKQLSELTAANGWSHTNVFAAEGLLATYEGTDTVFDLTDWQGTKRGETSAAGCLGSWMSLPYGNDLTQSGTCPDASEHHYQGKVRDAETGYASGNDDFGARYFASSEGRWLTPDWAAAAEAVPYATYGSPQSLNLYAFVGNNPLSRTDADGHSPYGAQMMCSDGPSGGQCGLGTDPFASRIFSIDGMGIGFQGADPVEGQDNQQETFYDNWLSTAQAEEYLMRADVMRPVIKDFRKGHFHLTIIHDGVDGYDPVTRTVFWDPNSALETTEGGYQTPALGLGHEMAHATGDPALTDRLRNILDRQFSNMEERRVILNYENPAARQLGEATRNNHSARLTYNVESPTSIIPVVPIRLKP
jgi:RHS repeat-associated protein